MHIYCILACLLSSYISFSYLFTIFPYLQIVPSSCYIHLVLHLSLTICTWAAPSLIISYSSTEQIEKSLRYISIHPLTLLPRRTCPHCPTSPFPSATGTTYDILSPPPSPTQLVTPATIPPLRRGRLLRRRRLRRSEEAVRVCSTCWLSDLWQLVGARTTAAWPLPPPLLAKRRPVALLAPAAAAAVRPCTATTASWASPKPPAELMVSVDCGVATAPVAELPAVTAVAPPAGALPCCCCCCCCV